MKAIVAFFLLLYVMPLSSQITFDNNGIRIGDEIIKQQVEYKDPGRSGRNVIWNFSRLNPVNPEYNLQYHAPFTRRDSTYILGMDTFRIKDIKDGELTVGFEHHTRYYYQTINNNLYCLGHENPITLVHYITPLPVISYPFYYGQSTDEIEYSSEGLYSSVIPMSSSGTIQIESDAYGKLILPNQDTLDNVIRIKTLQTINESDSLSKKGSIPVNMRIETYKWYSKGYRYPVFETIKSVNLKDTIHETFTTSFFYPTMEHYYLNDDEINLAVLDSLSNVNNNGGIQKPHHPNGEDLIERGNFTYNYYPNPVETELHIEYMVETESNVSISLLDMNGRSLIALPKKTVKKGLHYELIDCNSIPKGNYLLRLVIKNETISEKILKR